MEELRRRREEVSPLIEQEDSVVNDEEIKNEVEELWDNNDILVQVHAGQKPYNKRSKVLRRTTEEVTLAFVIHLIFLVYYIAVHVYDATVFKKCKNPNLIFVGYDTFGGRYKYLNYLTMWGLLIYFFLAFFTDIMPHSAAKVMFHKFTDWLFTTAVWPASWTVVIFFWVLSSVDIHLIGRTKEMIEQFPVLLDHTQHTFPVLIVIVEALLVYHRYSSNLNAAFSVFSFSTAYVIWILIVYTKLKIWVYPFINYLNPFTFIVFAAATFCWNGLLYIIGKGLAYWRWKERFLVLYEMAELEEDSN